MKRKLLLASIALFAGAPVAFPSNWNAETAAKTNVGGPFYLKGGAGISWPEDLTFVDDTGTGRLKFYPGLRLDVAGGYEFTPWLAAELEAGLVLNGVKAIEQDGSEDNTLVMVQRVAMANVVLRLPGKSRLHAFIGAGGGGVSTSLDSWIFDSSEHSGHDLRFAYQAFAGVRYEFNPRMALGLEYKFMRTEDHGFEQLSGTRNHSLALSVSVRF